MFTNHNVSPGLAKRTTIRKYEQLKIYQVNAIDGQLKKFTPKTTSHQGRLKIYLNESVNQIYFMIYAVNDMVNNKQIYDDLCLNEIDLDLFEDAVANQKSSSVIRLGATAGQNVDGDDVEERKRVEFRKRRRRRGTDDDLVYHAVEFNTSEAFNDLANTLNYLAEAYSLKTSEDDHQDNLKTTTTTVKTVAKSPVRDVKDANVRASEKNDTNRYDDDIVEIIEEKECVNEMIYELEASIRRGDGLNAALWARRLAAISARIDIKLNVDEKNDRAEIKDDGQAVVAVAEDDKASVTDNPVASETGDVENPMSVQEAVEATPTTSTTAVKTTTTTTATNRKVRVIWKTNLAIDDDDDRDQVRIELEIDVSATRVGELKASIDERLGLPANKQMMIVNDCSTASDDDFLAAYETLSVKRKSRERPEDNNRAGFASASVANDEPFQVYVINKDNMENGESENNWRLNKKSKIDYSELEALYNQDLNENIETFACDICLDDQIEPKQGVILKECMHSFCKECLRNHIKNCDEPVVKCPFRKEYACEYSLQEREVRALLDEEDYQKFHMKSLRMSEAAMQNTFHCLTPDCIGFCISEDNLNFFDCPVCEKVNCLRCNTIHMGKTCKEYQDDLKINAQNDKNAQKDKDALEKLINQKKAMYCPGCKIIVCKQTGCDWLVCPMCKIEICWATRGPRWGPGGRGDTSGGCKCNFVAGKPCMPNCGNCH